MPTIKLRLPSNRTLGNICVYGAIASISAVMYMRWKLEDRVRNADYYKLALNTLRQHKGAVGLLGEPIKDSGFDMSNTQNACNADKAQFEVKVNGSKDKGKVFFWASNDQAQGWLIDRLELETKQHPNKRFLLKKPEDYAVPENMDQQQLQNSTLPQETQTQTVLPQQHVVYQPPPPPQSQEQQEEQEQAQPESAPGYVYAPEHNYVPLQHHRQDPAQRPHIQTAEGGRMQ